VKIDPNDPRAAYLQAADDLRARITAGEFAPGTALPSIRRLADEYEISPQTVQNALRELRLAGLIVGQQGRASYVRDPSRHQADEARPDADRLAGAEARLRDLTGRVEALEAGNASLRKLLAELQDRIGHS
jgi:DNA-binding GntR family transcriptional regulator